VIKIASRAKDMQNAGRDETAVIALDTERYGQLVATAVDRLKENRDTLGYRGRRFVSEGMYIENDAAMKVLEQVGFQPGDIINRINDTHLTSYDKAIEALNEVRTARATSFRVEFYRQGAKRALTFTTGPDTEGI
jgi:hypothetical protein